MPPTVLVVEGVYLYEGKGLATITDDSAQSEVDIDSSARALGPKLHFSVVTVSL